MSSRRFVLPNVLSLPHEIPASSARPRGAHPHRPMPAMPASWRPSVSSIRRPDWSRSAISRRAAGSARRPARRARQIRRAGAAAASRQYADRQGRRLSRGRQMDSGHLHLQGDAGPQDGCWISPTRRERSFRPPNGRLWGSGSNPGLTAFTCREKFRDLLDVNAARRLMAGLRLPACGPNPVVCRAGTRVCGPCDCGRGACHRSPTCRDGGLTTGVPKRAR